jgi:diguanylate cyclase (GGDEF)-like protein
VSGHRPLDPAVARRVTGFAAAASLALATALPLGHFWIAGQREAATMRAEARLLARGVSEMVARNPDHWRFERVRIAALLSAEAADAPPGPRRVLDRNGATVAEALAEAPWPRVEVREPVYDAWRSAGEVRITRSLRGVLAETAWVAAAAVALGLLAFTSLRAVPLRLLRQALERATHLATHDPLTGLPNRALLREHLGRALAEAREGGGTVAALIVDLDRFKPVNDAHGHQAGDRLLRAVAERLRRVLRGTYFAARLGGDEFAVVARFEAGGEEPREAAARLAGRVVSALDAPFELAGGVSAQVGCSVGVAFAAGAEEGAEALLDRADAAMYRAKAEGRGCFRFFEAGMDERIRERAALASELRAALTADALEPHFQPLVDLGTGRLVGFEMLARWPHPRRGQVPPAEFVPIAEDTGLIGPMTERLLRRACRAATAWPAGVTLACNISPVQLRDRGLPAIVRAALAESGLPPGRLEIELTESALLDDFGLAREILGELKALGVRLSLDDFGTGYSSLRHLQALPIDKIKIDAGFVRSMAESAESRKIVAAVVGLGQSLGLPTVAEGVEDAAAAGLLAGLGCNVGQGWLFGRAMPEGEATALAGGGPERPAAMEAAPALAG